MHNFYIPIVMCSHQSTHPLHTDLALRQMTCSRSLVGLVATKSHACYLLGGTGWDWVRIPLGLNFSGSAGGVSGHT